MHDQAFDACGSRYHFVVVGVLRFAEGLDCGFGELREGWGRGRGDLDEGVAAGEGGVGGLNLVLD